MKMETMVKCFVVVGVLVSVSVWVAPQPCAQNAACARVLRNAQSEGRYHGYGLYAFNGVALCIVTPLLLNELVILFMGRRNARFHPVSGPQALFLDSSGPSLMTCVVLASLALLELLLAFQVEPWAHAMPPACFKSDVLPSVCFGAEPWRPIYTCRYVEWLICVPIMMGFAGHFGLLRPWSEVLPAMAMSIVYIALAWLGFVTDSAILRLTFVTAASVVAMWTFVHMVQWCLAFLRLTTPNYLGRKGRAILLFSQVIMNISYGVVNILAMLGYIDTFHEELLHTFTDVVCKAILVVFSSTTRTLEINRQMVSCLLRMEHQVYMTKSVLMANFDAVVACTVDAEGQCFIDDRPSRSLRQLETWLSSDMTGCCLNNFIASDSERYLFESSVKNSFQQAFSQVQFDADDNEYAFQQRLNSEIQPPVSQMMRLDLCVPQICPGKDNSSRHQPHLSFFIHLSALQCAVPTCVYPQPGLLAFRLDKDALAQSQPVARSQQMTPNVDFTRESFGSSSGFSGFLRTPLLRFFNEENVDMRLEDREDVSTV